MNMRETGEKILEGVADIRRKREETEILLRELEWLAKLMVRGIDPQQVKEYRYDSRYDKRRYPYCDNDVYNVAVLKDGSKVEMDPVSRDDPIFRRTKK